MGLNDHIDDGTGPSPPINIDGIIAMLKKEGWIEDKTFDRRLDGIDLCRDGPLCLRDDAQVSGEIGQSRRIGVTRAADSLLRFYVRGNWFVSGPRALNR